VGHYGRSNQKIFINHLPNSMENKPLTDAIMMAVSLLTTIIFCRFLYKHQDFTVQKGATFAMVFFAMTSFMNMWAHEWAIGIMAFVRWQQGLFVYDYRFYSLMLMGAVFILLGGYLLHQIKQLSRGSRTAHRLILVTGTIQILFSLPLFPLIPIGVMPALASILVMGILLFCRRRQMAEKQAAVTA
jgi:phosphoglycerol transferase MdoB-like AlkP superfamily enzyme